MSFTHRGFSHLGFHIKKSCVMVIVLLWVNALFSIWLVCVLTILLLKGYTGLVKLLKCLLKFLGILIHPPS